MQVRAFERYIPLIQTVSVRILPLNYTGASIKLCYLGWTD